jgi:hypothetical protein
MRITLAIIALALSGCAIAPPGVAGPYSRYFSPADVQEIAALVSHRSDMEPDILSMWTLRSDVLHLKVGHLWSQFGDYTTFTAAKHHGRWTITESSISHTGYMFLED